MKLKRYRIVRDNYCGYEVQAWRIWFPFWLECGIANTHVSIERAKAYIEYLKSPVVYTE
jgi:hypothetical protein